MIGERMVTLIDGREVSNCSPDWKAECEARWLLNNGDREWRRDYLARIQKRRGAAAANRLRNDMLKLWEMRRNGR